MSAYPELSDAARRVLVDALARYSATCGTKAQRKAFMERAYVSSMQDFVSSVEMLRAAEYVTETGAITAAGIEAVAR